MWTTTSIQGQQRHLTRLLRQGNSAPTNRLPPGHQGAQAPLQVLSPLAISALRRAATWPSCRSP
eukprot:1937333-Heterocapsa_arctica.AAC.1